MSEKFIGEMDDLAFEQMMEAFIARPTSLDDEIPAEMVFAMLDEAEKPEHTLELESVVVGDRLVLSAPRGAVVPSNVREIEVNLPHVRVIVSLTPAAA